MANNNQELPTITFTEGKDNTIIVSDNKSKLIYCSVKHHTSYYIIENIFTTNLKHLGEERFKEWVKHQERINEMYM
jgi:hypothetical protein